MPTTPLSSRTLAGIKERYDRTAGVVQFRKRRNGLMKKAGALHALTKAKVAVFIERDGRKFIFNTCDSLEWVNKMQETHPPPEIKGLQDVEHQTSATRRKSKVPPPARSTQRLLPPPTFPIRPPSNENPRRSQRIRPPPVAVL